MMAHEGHAAVAQVMQIIDDFFNAALIVHADVRDVAARRPHIVKNHGNAAFREFLDERLIHF